MHINSLPDLVLRIIFSKVPLQDLLNAGRVCPLWKYYQVETCKQVRSLTLLIGSSSPHSLITNSCFTLKYRDLLVNEGGKRMYSSQHLHKRFHLTYDSFTYNCVQELLNIFPHITKLEIAIMKIHESFQLSLIVPLLTKWSPMLKSLKMYIKFKGELLIVFSTFLDQETYEFVNLLEVINSMHSLEHLTLDTDTQINPPIPITYISGSPNRPGHCITLQNSMDLPILGRLKEFYLKSSDSMNIIEKSLQSYALSNDNLTQIGLDFSSSPYHNQRYPQLSQLESKIVYLPSCHSAIYETDVRDILKSFSTVIKFNFVSQFSFLDNLTNYAWKAISLLPQLSHLHLSSYYQGVFRLTENSRDHLPQLASVQVLTIHTKLQSTSEFEVTNWAHLFPNVQVIELTISTIDKFCSSSHSSTLWQLSKQELQKVLSAFVQCPKLHHIFTCEKYSPEIRMKEHIEMIKEWILLPVHDRKIVIQVEK